MSETTLDQHANWATELARSAHAANAIWGAAMIDDLLGDLIAHSLPNLSAARRKTLFGTEGAISRFSTRIDLANAMGLIDDDLRVDIHRLRKIRNMFAHAFSKLDLRSPEVNALLQNVKGYNAEQDPLITLLDEVMRCVSSMRATHERVTMSKLLSSPSGQ